MIRVCMVAYTNYITDTRVRREAEALRERGDTVDVICLRGEGDEAVRLFNGVRLFQVPAGRYHGASARTYLASYLRFFVAASWQLAQLHLRHPYQVIQVHTMPDFMVFTTAIPRLLGAKVVLDVHDLMPELYQSKYGLDKTHWLVRLITEMERWSIRFAHGAIAVHKPHLEALVAHGNPADKFIILLNLPDPKLFSQPTERGPKGHDGFRLIYHGTVARRHGLHVALAALATLRAEISDVQLQIIGVGEELGRLRELARELGLTQCVLIHEGWIPVEELLPILQGADLGLVPILSDGFTRYMLPVKLLEYVALGIPVVCSRTETIEAYFDDSRLQYCRPDDADDLAVKILDLYQHPDKGALLATNAQGFLQEHSWTHQMGRYFELMDTLAGSRLPGRGGQPISSKSSSEKTGAPRSAGRSWARHRR